MRKDHLPPDMTLRIFSLAKKKGLNVHNLTKEQYRALAMEARSIKEKIVAAVSAVESRVSTSLGVRNVPLEVYEERRKVCRSNICGSHGTLAAGAVEVCHACNCSDKFLDSKWKDARQKCPKGFWDRHRIEPPADLGPMMMGGA